MKSTVLKIGLVFLLLSLFSCSKDDTDPTPDPISNPIEEPTPDPDSDPDPDPDPDPTSQDDISSVDNAVQAFLDEYGVPGAALEVSVNEKMVYSKGYGWANVDMNLETKPDDVFRIASISKVFTSTAILKLIEENQLTLNDKVFGADGILGDSFGTASFTDDELNITVDHLLLHEFGGWGASSGGDPIDYQPQLGNSDFIEYVLNNWELTHAPGENFSYSNTGYWLLARIIEEVSGMPYETYIQNMIASTGATTFKTTTFREEDRESNEVEYYGTEFDSQYIYTIASRRDGDGGGVISAPDLLRFLCGIDGFNERPDILNSSSHELLTANSLTNLGRGLANWDAQNLYYFTGSLPGTRTWFMIEKGGVSIVLLLNYRSDQANFDGDFQSLLLNIAKDGSIPWQTDLDQF